MTYEFPASFPKSALAKVQAERLRGEQVLGEKKNSIRNFADAEALLLELVLRVFVAFAEEGHKLGIQGSLTVEDVESECLQFLRVHAFDAGLTDRYFLVPPLGSPE